MKINGATCIPSSSWPGLSMWVARKTNAINKFATEGSASFNHVVPLQIQLILYIEPVCPGQEVPVVAPPVGAWNIQFSEWKSTLVECLIATQDQEWPAVSPGRSSQTLRDTTLCAPLFTPPLSVVSFIFLSSWFFFLFIFKNIARAIIQCSINPIIGETFLPVLPQTFPFV